MARPAQAKNEWLVLVFLSLGFFMILLDTTIVNIAIPAMISGLNSSLDQILWVINAYLLAYAVLLITAGRLGDFFGPRRLFALGLVVFTVASALCGRRSPPPPPPPPPPRPPAPRPCPPRPLRRRAPRAGRGGAAPDRAG